LQIQRAGHCAWDPNVHGLFLYMPEPWAFKQLYDLESQSYKDNPDLPLPPNSADSAPTSKTKSIPKNQQISQGSLAYIQTSDCRRQFQATYLGDRSPNSLISLIPTVLTQFVIRTLIDVNKNCTITQPVSYINPRLPHPPRFVYCSYIPGFRWGP